MTKICNDRGGYDKKIHAIMAMSIAALVGVLIAPAFPSVWLAGAVAFAVAMAAGIWKELRDARQKGNHFCVWDLLADAVGAFVGSALASAVAALANYCCLHAHGGNLINYSRIAPCASLSVSTNAAHRHIIMVVRRSC